MNIWFCRAGRRVQDGRTRHWNRKQTYVTFISELSVDAPLPEVTNSDVSLDALPTRRGMHGRRMFQLNLN